MNSVLHVENSPIFQGQQENPYQVGGYSLVPSCVLGYGCSSTVFRGADNLSNEPVAIKVIELKRLGSTIEKVLLENEKTVVATLTKSQLRGVTRHYETIESKGKVYMVMECCQGGDLEKIISQSRLGEEALKKYLLELVSAYIELSRLRVVHRDLKPANILVRQNGSLSIADFGFAVIQEEQTKRYDYSLGSPVYCSPESLREHKYGAKSDIWALGVIAYKILTGKTPWKGKNTLELIQRMKKVPIEPMLADLKDATLKKFIIGCCSVSLQKRFGIKELEQIKLTLENQINFSRNTESDNNSVGCEKPGPKKSCQTEKKAKKQVSS